jgi:hypothetical protein
MKPFRQLPVLYSNPTLFGVVFFSVSFTVFPQQRNNFFILTHPRAPPESILGVAFLIELVYWLVVRFATI